MIIICPICEKEKRKSIVRIGKNVPPSFGDADEFWDEDGRLHRHDPNNTGASYQCSNGHVFFPPGNPCPSCGHKWESDEGKQIAFEKVAVSEVPNASK